MKTHLLHIASVALALVAVACSSSDSSSSSSSSSSSGSTGSSGSSGATTSGGTGTSASAQQTAINGTWDITAAGSDKIGTSSMTINGGQITGTIAGEPEDESASSDGSTAACSSTSKITFSITVNGDAATAAFNTTYDDIPSGCSGSAPVQSNLTATRKSGSNTSNDTFSGNWTVNDADNQPAFAVNILSLIVKAWSTPDTSGTPTLTSTIANGQASSQTTDDSLTFAARKQ